MTAPFQCSYQDATCMVWPVAPAWNGMPTAAIGKFFCPDEDSGYALLTQVMAELQATGIQAVIGPMDGDTWHSYRLAIKTFDDSPPFVMEPRADPLAFAAFAKAGFSAISHYASGIANLSAVWAGFGGPPDVTLRPFAAGKGDLETIHLLSNAAFARSPFFTPLTWSEFEQLYAPLLRRLLPELVLLAEDTAGQAVGFVFGMPDPIQKQTGACRVVLPALA